MTAVYALTLSLLGAAFALTTLRLLRGPTAFDRIMALDVLAVLLISGIAVHVAAQDEPANSTLLVVIAVLGFVGSVTAARLAGERGEHG
ncbi:monovalent cation/H+ antiporter complex subunit F [Actinomadura sp. WAC 06369]|uniref:monovalent cation/H+ antiporter complex subunit F n=1 Tax=Actinomadura sp. WAC 06369 TaxID=2203193 RepID=UPI000F7ACB08|nr:monovalent cation/H+ antiporter complex subunit F [Actinomadura sp. WAC 06369]RSN68479.1 sodium:proton antiporter [Actinomadura sp. WAC 06369]